MFEPRVSYFLVFRLNFFLRQNFFIKKINHIAWALRKLTAVHWELTDFNHDITSIVRHQFRLEIREYVSNHKLGDKSHFWSVFA